MTSGMPVGTARLPSCPSSSLAHEAGTPVPACLSEATRQGPAAASPACAAGGHRGRLAGALSWPAAVGQARAQVTTAALLGPGDTKHLSQPDPHTLPPVCTCPHTQPCTHTPHLSTDTHTTCPQTHTSHLSTHTPHLSIDTHRPSCPQTHTPTPTHPRAQHFFLSAAEP